MATLTSIEHAYACSQDQKALEAWTAKYASKTTAPKPSKTKKTTKKPPAVKVPPKPVVPAYCPAQGAG